MLTLFTGTGEYENRNGYKIGEHFDKLFGASRKTRNEYAGDIKSTKDVG
jgi:hypothetical protein